MDTWPKQGIPDKPEAWLLTCARNKIVDGIRHHRVRRDKSDELVQMAESTEMDVGGVIFPDERLKLMFACTHPAIDIGMRTPLILQTVIGLNIATISQVYLVPPATMGQRLVRMKQKIRDAGIRFEVPENKLLASRLEAVAEAVYAIYGVGWDSWADTGQLDTNNSLTDEALWLAKLLVHLVPNEPEVRGLLALILFCEARSQARRMRGYLPLEEQDPALWSTTMIADAEEQLTLAATYNKPGRFQLEAAIQSAHVQRRRSGHSDMKQIALLYQGLVNIAPILGAK